MNLDTTISIFKKNNFINKFYAVLFILFAFLITISNEGARFVEGLIVMLFIINLFFLKRKDFSFNDKNRFLLLSLSLIYLFYIIGIFYSENLEYGYFDLETKFSFLILPIIFFAIDRSLFKNDLLHLIKYSFVFGSLISSLILIYLAANRYLNTHQISEFYYNYLSFKIHPSYYALYTIFSIAIVLDDLFSKDNLRKSQKFALIFLIVWFSFIIVLLSSKAGFISLWILFILYYLFFGFTKKTWKTLSVYLFSFVIFVLIIIKLFPNMSNRMNVAANSVISKESVSKSKLNETHDGSNVRLEIWKISLNLIISEPIFGYGTGDVKDVLAKAFIENDFQYGADNKMNCHNQFLQTMISIGVFGLLALLYFFSFPLYIAIKKKSIFLFSFIIIVGINCLFESILERQFGIIFITFFIGFLTSNLLLYPNKP